VLQLIYRKLGESGELTDDTSKHSPVLGSIKPKVASLFGTTNIQRRASHGGATNAQSEGLFVSKINDDMSHFTLRLGFSRLNKLQQNWFIQQECRLLSLRLILALESESAQRSSGSDEVFLGRFLRQNGVDFPIVICTPDVSTESAPPLQTHMEGLESVEFADPKLNAHIQNSSHYATGVSAALKVPAWPDGGQFVKRRRCFVSGGFAFVPFQYVDRLLTSRFDRLISSSFDSLKRQESYLQRKVFDDIRLRGLFKTLERDHLSLGTAASRAESALNIRLSPENLNELSKASFPPCMRRLSDTLKTSGHLKYQGRLQLWRFFKSCGMTVEEQLSYWKSVWDQPEKFDKQHKYNIRHAYGLEGKRVAYSSYPCSKIIHELPITGGAVHGCPFKTFDRAPLRRLLQSYGAPPLGHKLEKSLDLAEAQHIELACVEFFKCTHSHSAADAVGTAPISYFKESTNYYQRKQGGTGGGENDSNNAQSTTSATQVQHMID